METNGRPKWEDLLAVARRIEDKLDAHVEKVEGRLDSLERWKSYLTGAVAIIGTGLPILVAVLFRG